jgi:hypothetical protein
MSHFVTPVAVAAAVASVVPRALAQGLAGAPRFVGMPITDEWAVADKASLPALVCQPQICGGDLWHGGFNLTAVC